MAKCEQCDSNFVETIEESQVKGKWRCKRECIQCHARCYSFLEEAEVESTEVSDGGRSLDCERCHDKAPVLYCGGSTDSRMVCIRCRCEIEENTLNAQYRASCSY